MIKQLPIPYLSETGRIFNEIELKKPTGAVLANVREALDTTNEYNAMRIFASGCCVKLISDESSIEDPVSIKSAMGKISNKSLEYICTQVMIDYYQDDDYVEGLYICPRCGFNIISERKEDDGIVIDTRDRISDLEIGFMTDISNMNFEVDLGQAITLESQATKEEITSITMRMPVTEDYIKAIHSVGNSNPIKIQYHVYGQCIIKANGIDVTDAWRRAFGMFIFNKIENTKQVFKTIGANINKFGINPMVRKVCTNCNKEWEAQINSTNFFGSALQ